MPPAAGPCTSFNPARGQPVPIPWSFGGIGCCCNLIRRFVRAASGRSTSLSRSSSSTTSSGIRYSRPLALGLCAFPQQHRYQHGHPHASTHTLCCCCCGGGGGAPVLLQPIIRLSDALSGPPGSWDGQLVDKGRGRRRRRVRADLFGSVSLGT